LRSSACPGAPTAAAARPSAASAGTAHLSLRARHARRADVPFVRSMSRPPPDTPLLAGLARRRCRVSETAIIRTSRPNVGPFCILLESPGFAQNFGSCGEVEGLHLVGVLTFGDEFREDVGLVGIQQKFRKALA